MNWNTKTKKEIIDEINNIIKYDNTNKIILYGCLEILSKINEKEEFNNLIKNSKFCFTKKFSVDQNKNLNYYLSNLGPIQNGMIIFENDEKIIKEIKETFKYLDKSIDIFNEIKEADKKFKIEDLKFKIAIDNKNNYSVIRRKDENMEINNLCKNIFEVLKFYVYIKQYDYFLLNQPVDYKRNQTLYLFHIFNKLYNSIIEFNNDENTINIIESIFVIYGAMKKFKNDILNEIEENHFNINDSIEKKIRFFFFCLKTDFDENMLNDLKSNIESMFARTYQLNKEVIEKFLENNKEVKSNFSIEGDDLIFNYKSKKYKFNINIYNEGLLNAICDNKNREQLLKQLKWNPIYFYNFFEENDINYMKNLIKKILGSKLFKHIWGQYSDAQDIVDYYFANEENIDELLKNIDFYPYSEDDFCMQGLTFHYELKMIVSGLPISNIRNEKDFYCYKILETARKIIIILHEISHYIKRALNLITNDEIFNTTIEAIGDEYPDIPEAGKILENIIFNLDNPFEKSAEIYEQNPGKVINSDCPVLRLLNLQKALKILNVRTYDNDILTFKNIINNRKEIEKNEMDDGLLHYIDSTGFDLDNYFENNNNYKYYIIDCTKKRQKIYYLLYRSDNHNNKH